MRRSRRRRRRKIPYGVKLAAVCTGMLIYSFKLQSYGNVKTVPEAVVFETSPLEFNNIQILSEKEDRDENKYQFYEVPEGEFPEVYQKYTFEICEKYGVPYEIVFSIIQRESRFDRYAIGDDGESFGYMQVMQKWHEDRMIRLDVEDLSNPEGNILVGVDYLSELLGKYPEMNRALMAYNCGPTTANELWNQGIYHTKYTKEVMEEAEAIRNEIAGGSE